MTLDSSARTTSNAPNSNKITPQIKIRKPPHRKTSPVNWFPRKKVDSYLNRKIKMLQELDGMNLTLDQTLGNSNPHYSRVLREKMAARESANKAILARRAALVEASWCRILRAARIPSDDAEAQLSKAEKGAVEAFEAAQSMGVIMYDLSNCPKKHCRIETSSVNGEGSSTHMVTASFETAFDVDKEVAAAVKTAFVRLANCPSFSTDEFQELLRKINENPDADDKNQDISEFSSECDSESGTDLDFNMPPPGTSHGKSRRRQSLEKFDRIKLVGTMLERLKCLQEDELSSLATIVATCGLNAALAQEHNIKLHNPSSAIDHTSSSILNFPARRMSLLASGKKQVGCEIPSLDKFLVKHMTKLEREIQEAKNKRRNGTESDNDRSQKSVDGTLSETITDLGSILVKNYSKFEKEINKAKLEFQKDIPAVQSDMPNRRKDHAEVPSLDKFLVKHISRLEREVQEAKSRTINEGKITKLGADLGISSGMDSSSSSEALAGKENVNINKEISMNSETQEKRCNLERSTSVAPLDGANDVTENKDGLDKILKEPIHGLEREKMQALSLGGNGEKYRRNQAVTGVTECESLDKILVKHVSRLEKEKMRFNSGGERVQVKRDKRHIHLDANAEGGLDQILVKHKSKLEREKMVASKQEEENPVSASMSRREARERELLQAWAGLSLGNSIKPHLSKLELDKAAWIKAEEEERRQAMKQI
ncbi:hypothetical protein HN51_007450 [Arachis hypogaea]|uniref:Uncharacterized protein n=1 Tax=Arachis hypogaea TaxID=3818 RepID=A0A445D7N7_ARAHY|nr:uncharacterized protein LOC112801195 [Arachis hypogaea]XP_029154151.1 uncharacterized protein LOC112801195 [Arachis hypogaea]QHO41592.1 uncharacterized protein DS421_5g147060 [Arachis hypogaea]RYR59265.1 hypothetical protein Ahy_A05g025116 isoform A [Arachis hypogaea]RYR59266.1 hypothetical protein Ahy_A05g025116 isoform B [Arachis hypogaea]